MRAAVLSTFYLLVFWLDFLPLCKKRGKKELIIYGVVFVSTYLLLMIRSLDVQVPFVYPFLRGLFENR